MATNLGNLYVDLKLNDQVYKQQLKEVLVSTETTAKGLDQSWKALGVKTDAYYDEQRRTAENAYTLILKSGQYTTNELVRAEESKRAKIIAINNQQNAAIIRAEEARTAAIAAQNNVMLGHWNTLGIKSTTVLEQQKADVMRSYNAIIGTVQKGSQDYINIENAKNARLQSLNDEMVQKHDAGVEGIIRGVLRWYAAYYFIKEAIDMVIITPFIKGFKAVEEYNTSVISMAAMYMTFAKDTANTDISTQWKNALSYSRGIIPVLENIAAKTLLSGQETIALANAFARSGVFLNETNQKQIESFTAISNALPLLTQGQEIMKQINSEIRGLMNGQDNANNMLIRTLKEIDPLIEDHLKTWRTQGTVLENIGGLLKGFIPATVLLELEWQAVKSTLDTTVTQVLRGGMLGAYEEIIDQTRELDNWLQINKADIESGIVVAWSYVKNIVGAVFGVLSGFKPILSDLGLSIGAIAYGWGGVLAVLKPIGEFLGNSVATTYELVKMIGNAAVAAASLASGNFEAANIAWANAKKSYAEIERLAYLNNKIIFEGISNSILKYAEQAEASRAANDKTVKSSQTATNAQATNTRLLQTMTKEALEERAKLEAKTHDGAVKLMNQQVEIARKSGVDKKTIEEYTAAQMAIINQKYHSTVQKEAKSTQKVEEDILTQLTKQNKTFYEAETKSIKSNYELKLKQGANALAASMESYTKQSTALNAWYSAQSDIINRSFANEKVKEEKLNSLRIEYKNKSDALLADKAKKETDYATKNLQTEATLYKTIDQYSAASVNAAIAALNKKYNDYKNYTDKTALLEKARSVEEQKIIASSASAKAKMEENYYMTVKGWSASYFTAVQARLNAEANLEALKVGASFDRQAWLTTKGREEVQKRLSAESSFYAGITGYEDKAYAKKIQNIELERQKNIQMYGDVGAANQKARDASIKAYVDMANGSNNFMTGVKAGFADLTTTQTKWGAVGVSTVKAFTDNAKSQLQANLFNVWKGNLNSIEMDWTSMLDAIGETLTKKISDMVIEAAADEIILLFKSEWTEGGSNVLGIVNSVLGFAGSLFSGSGTNDSALIDGFFGLAHGGWVPGYANGGNSPMNDTVRAMLSPGEYVVDRESIQAIAKQGQRGDTLLAHINPAEAALLQALGGAGTINPRTGLLQFYDSSTPPAGWVPITSTSTTTPIATTPATAAVVDPAYQAQMAAIAAKIAANDKIIATNQATAAEAKKYGYSSLYEGQNLVNVKGYKSGEPIGGRSWVPTTELNTTAGKRYFVPIDLIQGGALYNPGGYNGNWFYPNLRSGYQSALNSFAVTSVPSSWTKAAGIGSTWGGIQTPTSGWYLTPAQYMQLYAGGYWRPTPTVDSMNGAYVSFADMQLNQSGIYAGGGEDTWWTLNPHTGDANWYAQEGQNRGNGLLSSLLTMVGSALLAYSTGWLGNYWLGPLLGGTVGAGVGGTVGGIGGAAGTGIGAAVGSGLGGLIQGQDAATILTNMAITGISAGVMAGIGNLLADIPATSSAGIYDISNYGTIMNPETYPSNFMSSGFGVTLENAANTGLGSQAIYEGVAGGFSQAFDASNFSSLLNSSNVSSSLMDSIKTTGIKWAAKKALNMAFSEIFPKTAGGYMSIEYMGANTDILKKLAKTMQGFNDNGQFTFPIISARNGLGYVPRDNFLVNTHEGERVLTKDENREYRQGQTGQLVINRLQVYLDGKEVKENMKVIADGVVVARNSRANLNKSIRLYK